MGPRRPMEIEKIREKFEAHRERGAATILLTMTEVEWLLSIAASHLDEQRYNDSFE